jgi:hypothetical protein
LQKTHIAAITEQSWANYTYLRDKPIDPASGWREAEVPGHACQGR